jgi:hypothetical protein
MGKTDIAMSEEDAFDLAMIGDQDVGAGNETLTSKDIAIPYIGILQALSPQCQKGGPDFIKGAEPGFFFQNVNNIMWNPEEAPLLIVPCAFDRVVNEWRPREAGGGLVAVHPVNTPLLQQAKPNDKGVPTLPSGHNLIDTATHYVLYKSPITDRFEPAVISMKSTNLKKSRLWNSLLTQQLIPGTDKPAPRWLFQWEFRTVVETGNNNTWYNFEISRAGTVDRATYEEARKMYTGWKAGNVRAPVEGADADTIPF